MARLNEAAIGECGGMDEDAVEFAEVAGPRAILQLRQSCIGKHLGAVSDATGEAAQEPCGEDRNVFDALAQWRDDELDPGEEGIEIRAEVADCGEGAEVAVGGDQDACAGAAQAGAVRLRRWVAALGAAADEAKQCGLERGREPADSVEVEGSSVGGFQQLAGGGDAWRGRSAPSGDGFSEGGCVAYR